MSLPRYRCLPHAADLRLRVWGRDERELLGNALAGCLALAMGRAPRGAASAWRSIEPWPQDPGDRLVRVVNEALFLLYTQRLAVVEVKAARAGASVGVRSLAAGACPELEIKAATFHDLKVVRCQRGRRADLVLDT